MLLNTNSRNARGIEVGRGTRRRSMWRLARAGVIVLSGVLVAVPSEAQSLRGNATRGTPGGKMKAARTNQANEGAADVQSAWDQMFGGIPEGPTYQVFPYWIDPATIEMFLIDTATSQPEDPVSVEDLYRRWAVASGILHLSGSYRDSTVSHDDGSFTTFLVWGYYEAVPSPGFTPEAGLHLLIGAVSSWGVSGDEHSRGVLDQFIPLDSEEEIGAYQAEIYPPVSYTLEHVADLVAAGLASVDTSPTGGGGGGGGGGSGDDDCYLDEPPGIGDVSRVGPECHRRRAAVAEDNVVAGYQECLDNFNFCASQAESTYEAAKENCDSDRYYGDALIFACYALYLVPPAAITCAVVTGSLVAEAWRACLRAARILYKRDMSACHQGFRACCANGNCPWR